MGEQLEFLGSSEGNDFILVIKSVVTGILLLCVRILWAWTGGGITSLAWTGRVELRPWTGGGTKSLAWTGCLELQLSFAFGGHRIVTEEEDFFFGLFVFFFPFWGWVKLPCGTWDVVPVDVSVEACSAVLRWICLECGTGFRRMFPGKCGAVLC